MKNEKKKKRKRIINCLRNIKTKRNFRNKASKRKSKYLIIKIYLFLYE
jgi:hypothetical protein